MKSMTSSSSEYARAEEDRIRAAYKKRASNTRYSWFSPGHLYMVQERERHTLKLLAKYGFTSIETITILEVGCGTGYWLREFIKWGARPENMIGVDLLGERIDEARWLCPASVRLYCQSATMLKFDDVSFDCVLQSTVFTSILEAKMKQKIASEMLRVVKPEGFILWYDYYMNNPNNSDVRGVKKAEIYKLFPDCHIQLRRITLAPPITRFLAPYSWLACALLAHIPFLCTHYLGIIRKRVG